MIKKLHLLLIIIYSSTALSQSNCNILNEYKSAQYWIKNIQKTDVKQRKDSILNFYKCNKNDTNKSKLLLIIIYNGIILDEIPNYKHHIKRKDFYTFNVLNSICEQKVYPQRCELGTILIESKTGLISNTINGLNLLKIKKSKLYLTANYEMEFEITNENFIDGLNKEKKQIILHKGKNIIDFKSKNKSLLIVLKNKSDKMTIVL